MKARCPLSLKPGALLEIARRNDVPLPADTAEELQQLYTFTDLAHFIEIWFLVTAALRTADDFRQITVDYVEEAARHGAVYVEGIFAPTVPARNGVDLDAMFEGYCDGVQEARERLGVEVRLTPDLNRTSPPEEATGIVRRAIAFRERGVVGIGLGGVEDQAPPEQFAAEFRLAREGGLGSVPHAGEVIGPPSVWGALTALEADRIRHGIRCMEDPVLVRELVDRGVVMDVCPTANVRVGAVPSYDRHPLPEMVAAGLWCSLSTYGRAVGGVRSSRSTGRFRTRRTSDTGAGGRRWCSTICSARWSGHSSSTAIGTRSRNGGRAFSV